MKVLTALVSLFAAFSPSVVAFSPAETNRADVLSTFSPAETNRADVLSTISRAAAAVAAGSAATVLTPSPSFARGRATLEAAYDRYTPRIIAGGQFYAQDFKKMIEKNDFKAIIAATVEADRSKIDGGVSERAAQAGGFSDARVLTAADLYAGAFSDNSISPKTKAMRKSVEKMREVVAGINAAAREASGEESGGGGLFGLGSKKASPKELAVTIRKLYLEGGQAYNQYIFDANDDLPVQLKNLPYLS